MERVFSRSSYILGEEVEALEAEFARAHDCAYGVGVGSGTDALQLALRACGVKAGDEVLTVANVWVPTVCAIRAAGARPVFVDIAPRTFGMDPEKIAGALTPRTAAILPVHLYGQVVDMDPILEAAAKRGIPVIEDACQAHGARYRGRKAGSLGAAGCFSFYPTKNLGAYGDGGMVVTNDAAVARSVRSLRNYGETQPRYTCREVGVNSRLDELQAAMLRVKLRRLDGWNERRRRHAARYDAGLAGSAVRVPCEARKARHVYHLYVVRSARRDELRAWLAERGVGTAVHYPIPVHLQPAFARLGYRRGDLPETERACEQVLSLPIYPELTAAQVRRVIDAIREFPGRKGRS
ncbi:MAG: DegT/DnrJ/EryC1/StrS family aminotransferase [Deltaproteobacteria bacterium]|nr:DegT/DnrJ/EryC1/StrS family aminotransferase [Deltaproteobacteria bacterium]